MPVTPADLPTLELQQHVAAQFWIDMSTVEVDAQKWLCAGKDPAQGIILLASHYLTVSPDNGGGQVQGGLVVSEARGGVSLSVTHGAAAAGDHAGSLYGQAYDAILKTICGKRRRQLPPPPQPAA